MTTTGRPVAFGLQVGQARPLAGLHPSDTPIPVGVTKLGDLADVDVSTGNLIDVPMIWRQGSDHVWRLSPLDDSGEESSWGQEVRFGSGPPEDLTAPPGSVWVDVTNGYIYEAEETP